MLPSMCAPMESETFPPDVCCSRDFNLSPGRMSGDSMDNDSDLDLAEEALCDDDPNYGSSLEGAVGNDLPDLCNTSIKLYSSTDSEVPSSDGAKVSISKSLYNDTENINIVDVVIPKKESEKCDDLAVSNSNPSNVCYNLITEDNSSCQGATNEDKLNDSVDKCDTASCALSDIQTKSQSNKSISLSPQKVSVCYHPLISKLKCSAMIPSCFLTPISLQFHGMPLGFFERSTFTFETPRVFSPTSAEVSRMSEEEQIRLAKRMGLIQHLPCEVFDGAAKTRECVICMIDFVAGDRIRYLPCMHTYHTECIDDWLVRSFTCPSCLEPVDAALLSSYETA